MAKSNGLLLGLLAAAGVAVLAMGKSTATAGPSLPAPGGTQPGGSGGTQPGGSRPVAPPGGIQFPTPGGGLSGNPNAPGSLQHPIFNNPAILRNPLINKPPVASPVDWTQTDWTGLGIIANLKSQGFSSAQALAVYQGMQQGLTQSQSIIQTMQTQGFSITQADQIASLIGQGVSLSQAIAQTTPAPSQQLSTWQQKASSSISQTGIDPVTAQAIASQLSDAQARYMDWLIRLANYSYDDARVPTASGASELATGWQVESTLSANKQKALGWLFQDAWSPTFGTPSISANQPPSPSVVRRLAQLASALSDTDALLFLSKIQTGTGIRAAYEQTIGAGGRIQVQQDGTVTSTS